MGMMGLNVTLGGPGRGDVGLKRGFTNLSTRIGTPGGNNLDFSILIFLSSFFPLKPHFRGN